jgi:hypothetical protein
MRTSKKSQNANFALTEFSEVRTCTTLMMRSLVWNVATIGIGLIVAALLFG